MSVWKTAAFFQTKEPCIETCLKKKSLQSPKPPTPKYHRAFALPLPDIKSYCILHSKARECSKLKEKEREGEITCGYFGRTCRYFHLQCLGANPCGYFLSPTAIMIAVPPCFPVKTKIKCFMHLKTLVNEMQESVWVMRSFLAALPHPVKL